MPLGTRIADYVHRSFVLVLAGTTVFGAIQLGVLFNENLKRRADMKVQKQANSIKEALNAADDKVAESK
ncbi:uncharacterized protein VTP21DRAFT_9483 [Calcarisporiella thermophila]|uniref:uncharacterized protein n=1 Tax=Calcarisporiella thermophila TaxID=911321 RepID=UPI00374249D0